MFEYLYFTSSGKAACEPGKACWLPPQELDPNNKTQDPSAPSHHATTDTQLEPEQQTTSTHPSGDLEVVDNCSDSVKGTALVNTAKTEEADMDVVHVILPDDGNLDNQLSLVSPSKVDSKSSIARSSDSSINGERPSEDYSVAMSLALLSTSGTNI